MQPISSALESCLVSRGVPGFTALWYLNADLLQHLLLKLNANCTR